MLPSEVSGAQVVRALQRLGFAIVRQRGSHSRMEKAGLGAPRRGRLDTGSLPVFSAVQRGSRS